MLRTALATKKVTISCAFTLGTLHLDIVETYDCTKPAADPMHYAFFHRRTDVLDYLKIVLAGFTRTPSDSKAANQLCEFYTMQSNGKVTTNESDANVKRYSQCNTITLRLPPTLKELLILLGSIDTLLPHLKYHERADGYDILFYYHGRQVVDEGLILSRKIATWMLETIKQNEYLEKAYHDIIPSLETLLTTEIVSLAPAIRQLLYPDVSLLPAIENVVTDPSNLQLFNPETTYPAKAHAMLQWMRSTLKEKSHSKTRNNESDKKIHLRMNERFEQLAKHQATIWKMKIETLYGKIAADNGMYEEIYTEIKVLNEATRALNAEGLMTLDYQNSKTYLEFYRKKVSDKYAVDPSVLGLELPLACGYLALEFKPGQDFHQGPAVFTLASTTKLKALGLHWNKEYGIKLLKYGQLFRALHRSTPLDADLITRILHINDNTLSQEEVRALASNKSVM